jgi:poly(3-hydroxybutyrate) depolymerase
MTAPSVDPIGARPKAHRYATVEHKSDTRFRYALMVPGDEQAQPPLGLLVVVHGSQRRYLRALAGFAEFGRQHHLAVMAPQFPGDLFGDGNHDGYKFLFEHNIRYDQLLNDMMAEAGEQLGFDVGRVLLHGYSGGGQFVHRYLYLHPERVLAAAIGAPGEVTLLDDHAQWWAGIANSLEIFGKDVDKSALKKVPVQLMVGEKDVDVGELVEQPHSKLWGSDEARRAATRIDRIRVLHRSFESVGATAALEIMPGVSHGSGSRAAMVVAQRFFAAHLPARAASPLPDLASVGPGAAGCSPSPVGPVSQPAAAASGSSVAEPSSA